MKEELLIKLADIFSAPETDHAILDQRIVPFYDQLLNSIFIMLITTANKPESTALNYEIVKNFNTPLCFSIVEKCFKPVIEKLTQLQAQKILNATEVEDLTNDFLGYLKTITGISNKPALEESEQIEALTHIRAVILEAAKGMSHRIREIDKRLQEIQLPIVEILPPAHNHAFSYQELRLLTTDIDLCWLRFSRSNSINTNGWKLHLNIAPTDLAKAIPLLLPILLKNFDGFKVYNLTEKKATASVNRVQGRQITIFLTTNKTNGTPNISPKQLARILQEINQLLVSNQVQADKRPLADAETIFEYISLRNDGENQDSIRNYVLQSAAGTNWNPYNFNNPYQALLKTQETHFDPATHYQKFSCNSVDEAAKALYCTLVAACNERLRGKHNDIANLIEVQNIEAEFSPEEKIFLLKLGKIWTLSDSSHYEYTDPPALLFIACVHHAFFAELFPELSKILSINLGTHHCAVNISDLFQISHPYNIDQLIINELQDNEENSPENKARVNILLHSLFSMIDKINHEITEQKTPEINSALFKHVFSILIQVTHPELLRQVPKILNALHYLAINGNVAAGLLLFYLYGQEKTATALPHFPKNILWAIKYLLLLIQDSGKTLNTIPNLTPPELVRDILARPMIDIGPQDDIGRTYYYGFIFKQMATAQVANIAYTAPPSQLSKPQL